MFVRSINPTCITALKIAQNQNRLRFLHTSMVALRDTNAGTDGIPKARSTPPSSTDGVPLSSSPVGGFETKDSKPISEKMSPPSAGGMNMGGMVKWVALLGVPLVGIYMWKKSGSSSDSSSVTDTIKGKYVHHKVNKEYEDVRKIITDVTTKFGGKDLADKAAALMDNAKDSLEKAVGELDTKGMSKDLSKAYQEAKAELQKITQNINEKDVKESYNQIKHKLEAIAKSVKEEAAKSGTKGGYEDLIHNVINEINKHFTSKK